MNDQAFLEAKIAGLENEVRNLKASLRDDFAKAALAGLIVDAGPISSYSQSVAADAYKLANAMLEARKS